MFNFITQNRRGTTQEWEESTVIPRQVEFVIEEFSDGTYKIKVKVMSTGNAEYKASDWKTVTVTIKIK